MVGPEQLPGKWSSPQDNTDLKSFMHVFNYLLLGNLCCSNCLVAGFSCVIIENIIELKHSRKMYEFEYRKMT